MVDIKIYGEVVPFQDIWHGLINLSSVQEQLLAAKGADIRVRINCVGGDVDEGFAIYSELRRYAKEHDAKVTTLAEGRCASIATVIFLAGDERITTEYTQPFVHNAWTYLEGDAKQVMRIAVDLEACNKQIAEHYAKHTDLTYEEARELMDQETSISPEECVAIRFATSIEEVMRPVALRKRVQLNTNKMAKTEKKSFFAKMKALFSNKILFDANNAEVDFYELADDETVAVGDLATIDGTDAEGSVVMATGETFVFEAGVLTEIIPAGDEDEDEDGADTMALQAKVDELEALLSTASEKYNKAKAKIVALKADVEAKEGVIANFKAAQSRYAPERKKENKKPDAGKGNKFDKAIAALSKK
jgi:ATP-dependent protease ClpP protease subunit